MIFEEALAELRKGNKIRHPDMPEDEYFMGCYVTINPLLHPNGIETFKMIQLRGMSIVKMKGDRQHPDMGIGSLEHIPRDLTPCKHGNTPQICIFLLMANDWELIDV